MPISASLAHPIGGGAIAAAAHVARHDRGADEEEHDKDDEALRPPDLVMAGHAQRPQLRRRGMDQTRVEEGALFERGHLGGVGGGGWAGGQGRRGTRSAKESGGGRATSITVTHPRERRTVRAAP